MKKIVKYVAMASALALPVLALANGSPQAKSAMTGAGCFACHAVTHKVVGPAFGWVAYTFAHKAGADATLAHRIINGGAGYWNAWTGGIPMPPHPELTLAQAEQMAKWVMAQKPIAPPKP